MVDTDSQKRNWLGTVVFTDIVGYSRCSVEQQIGIKDHFNGLISNSIANTDESERVVIDTGDGIAICFLGDPEEAIVASMDLRAEVVLQSQSAPIPYEVRTGINLGPVRLVTDINGGYNVLGDGINVAQRVMSFAKPSQVLVSRSFYDVAWCLSDTYSKLFQYMGIRKDKHDREHVLYEVVTLMNSDVAAEPDLPAEPEVEEHTRVIRSRLANDAAPLVEITWEPEVLRQIENDLMEFIGPLAKVVVRKESARALSVEDLQVRIAKSIPAGEKRQAYMEIVSRRAAGDNSSTFAYQKTVALDQEPIGSAVAKAKAAASAAQWSQEELDRVQNALAAYVGPLAAMLVRKASRRATDEMGLYTLLANEIEDPNDRDNFLRSLARK